MLWCVAFLISAGRSTLIAVMPELRDEFALSALQLALLNSAPFWVYAIGAFLFGRLGDGSARARLIAAGLAFWAFATALSPFAAGFAMLVVARSLVALGEATYFPSGAALISDWHRAGLRTRALSVHQTGVFAGAGIGALGAGLLAERFGWRVPFVIIATLALLCCVLLVRWLRDPPLATAGVTSPQGTSRDPLATLLRRPAALYVCVVFLLASGASAGPAVWAPTYLHDEFGFDLARSAFYGAVTINLAGFAFVPIGALLAERLSGHTPIAVFYTLALGLALAGALLALLPFALTGAGVGLVLLASGAGKALFDGCIYAAMHEVTPPRTRATAVGLMTMIGFCGAGITPLYIAAVGARVGMTTAMTSMAALYALAVLMLMATRTTLRRAVMETRSTESALPASFS